MSNPFVGVGAGAIGAALGMNMNLINTGQTYAFKPDLCTIWSEEECNGFPFKKIEGSWISCTGKEVFHSVVFDASTEVSDLTMFEIFLASAQAKENEFFAKKMKKDMEERQAAEMFRKQMYMQNKFIDDVESIYRADTVAKYTL